MLPNLYRLLELDITRSSCNSRVHMFASHQQICLLHSSFLWVLLPCLYDTYLSAFKHANMGCLEVWWPACWQTPGTEHPQLKPWIFTACAEEPDSQGDSFQRLPSSLGWAQRCIWPINADQWGTKAKCLTNDWNVKQMHFDESHHKFNDYHSLSTKALWKSSCHLPDSWRQTVFFFSLSSLLGLTPTSLCFIFNAELI